MFKNIIKTGAKRFSKKNVTSNKLVNDRKSKSEVSPVTQVLSPFSYT